MRRTVRLLSMLATATLLMGAARTGPGEGRHDDIVDIASGSDTFSTLVTAVKAAGLVETLKSDGPLTVFAPTNEAFAALPPGTVQELLKPENRERLQAILTFHVIAGEIRSTDLLQTGSAATVNGKSVSVGLRVGNANVIEADIEASNGIIHVIDRVLLPADLISRMTPARLIEMAISRGASLYNHGQPGACAAVYEVTAEALLMDPSLGQPARAPLESALENMRSEHSADRQAWIMRRGLDRAYLAMRHSSSDH